ncbi:MAG TPA: tRNA(His) guanylyltransferase Thg1 family protein [Ktedonobacterales bacterium]|nr:tRNA(His) guanylyltransferase Thg1 family protein [Ktedonobacterales bacterium]
MNNDQFEAQMRALERYHGLQVEQDAFIVLRVDGRSFSAFTAARFQKPFDDRFHQLMITTARALLANLQGIYAYTESDEISVLLPRDTTLFDREVEKLVSISASVATGAFTLAYGESVCFDSRLCVCPTMQEVTDYFRWRQSDAERCALNGWAYWTLRKDGLSEQKASDMLGKQPPEFKRTLLLQHSIEWSNLPHWQRYGTGLYWEAYEKEGYNPLTGERIMAQRRKINVDEALPVRSDYTQLLQYLVAESSKKKSA